MKDTGKLLRSRFSLLLAVIAFCAVALASPYPAAWAACFVGHVTFYSDATETQVVGSCSAGCCQVYTCTGTMTNYYTQHIFSCD